ncbi:MAG TPA: hypothetical protein VLP43_08355 [Solirubrobacteraceae bacterium]|nr:hypothetical protein [Solirubrobacteraceae bacterium]
MRRITLPSGRSIEIVRFAEAEAPKRDLHVCPCCDSELVQPLAWSEVPEARWELVLECPNCAWSEAGTFERRQVEALEEQLDEGLAGMLLDLRRLTRFNMRDEIERFIAALQADLILPEDF